MEFLFALPFWVSSLPHGFINSEFIGFNLDPRADNQFAEIGGVFALF